MLAQLGACASGPAYTYAYEDMENRPKEELGKISRFCHSEVMSRGINQHYDDRMASCMKFNGYQIVRVPVVVGF